MMQTEIMNAAKRWMQANIDFPLVLAMVTETPRWTVAFIAIHEPIWIGVPLGVLLSFATSKAWRHYFETQSRTMLGFNIASIAMAVAVIAPVLFAMTEVAPHDVDIMQVLPVRAVWAWSVILALTTFVPLVQLAAVESAPTRRVGPPVQPAIAKAKPAKPQPVAKPAQLADEPLQVETASESLQDDAAQDDSDRFAEYRDLQSKDEMVQAAHVLQMDFGLSNAEIGDIIGKHETTVYRYLKEARNGVH